MQVVVDFKKPGWVKKETKNAVEGELPIRRGSDKNYIIGGTWSEGVSLLNEETRRNRLYGHRILFLKTVNGIRILRG